MLLALSRSGGTKACAGGTSPKPFALEGIHVHGMVVLFMGWVMFTDSVHDDIADHASMQAFIDDIIGAVSWGRSPRGHLPSKKVFPGDLDLDGDYWYVAGEDVVIGYVSRFLREDRGAEFTDIRIFMGEMVGRTVLAAHGDRTVFLRCLRHMRDPELICSTLRSHVGKARHALLHELSHHLDHVRGIPVCSSSRDDTPYFDRPGEVRAYFHNIAAPLFAVHALAGTDAEGALVALKALGISADGDNDAAVRDALSRTRLAGPRALLKEASPYVMDTLWERTGLLLSAVRDKVHGHGQDISLELT